MAFKSKTMSENYKAREDCHKSMFLLSPVATDLASISAFGGELQRIFIVTPTLKAGDNKNGLAA
jgi:hypothetical protein